MDGPVKRRYHSPLRAEQARATRLRILDAARALFLDQGYPATSIDAVAAAAHVSADTVYSVFGTKRNLLQQLMDVAVGGDDDNVALLDRPGPQAVRVEPERRTRVARFAAGVTDRIEAARPVDDILRSAAVVDAEVAALRDDIQLRQRRTAMTTVAGWLAGDAPLRDAMTIEDASDVIWALTSPELHVLLRDRCGWSRARFARWLGDTLERTLLPDAED